VQKEVQRENTAGAQDARYASAKSYEEALRMRTYAQREIRFYFAPAREDCARRVQSRAPNASAADMLLFFVELAPGC